MTEIILHNKKFKIYIKEKDLQNRIKEISEEILKDYKGLTPVFISLLNGAFWFTADLLKHINDKCELDFVKFKSYRGTNSSGVVTEKMNLDISIEERHVIIVEDIVDSGATLNKFMESLKDHNPSSLEIVSLFQKPEMLKYDIKIKYAGFKIPNKFIVGYGMDYDGLGRNYRDLYVEE